MSESFNRANEGVVLRAQDGEQDEQAERRKPEQGALGPADRKMMGPNPDGGQGGPGMGGFGGPGRRGTGPSRANWLYFLVACALLAYVFFSLGSNARGVKSSVELPTSEFVSAVEDGRVESATYTVMDGKLAGSFWEKKKDVGDEKKATAFTSTYVGNDSLSELMAKHPETKYEVDTKDPDFLADLLMGLLPTVVLVGLMFYFMRQMMGANNKAMQFGKTDAKTTAATRPNVKFKDVAGIDEAVEELEEIRDFLSEPERFRKLGAKIPRGVLLVGPPGTGKTLLAKAVAGEAGVPFFSISGSDFVEMFVGVGASRVRDLFKNAKEQSPSIIFIDEIDAVGRQRGAGLGGGHDEREQTLNQLLVEMDGFGANSGVIIIAATNRKDILDPALLRPGRFDRQILVSYPDVKGREEILKVHVRNKPMGPDVELKTVAKATVGFTGADLENVVNEAALLAARANKHAITMKEIEDATIKVIAGPEKRSKVVNDKEKRLTAYHEAGHAVCTYYCPTQDPVHEISIIPRGMAGGYTMSLPEDDRGYMSKTAMQENIVTLLGGRMAELIVLDDISTGASNDLERATQIARSMVTRYGFSDKLGPVVYGQDQGEVFLGMDINRSRNYSEEVAAEIDEEIRRIIEEAYARAREILEAHRDQLEVVAQYLMEHEKVGEFGFKALMEGREVNPDEDQHGIFSKVISEAQKAAAEPALPEAEAEQSAEAPADKTEE